MTPHRALAGSLVLAAAVLLDGCALAPGAADQQALDTAAATTVLGRVPFYPDERIFCGPATLAAALNWAGDRGARPDALRDALIVPDREGALQAEMAATARRRGRLAWPLPPRLSALAAEVQAGRPVIVLQNLALSWWPRWHYAVVVGMMPDRDRLVLNTGPRQAYPVDATVFDRTWARAGRWAMVVTAPGELPATAEPRGLLAAIHDLERVAGPGAAIPYWGRAVARWPRHGALAVALANAQDTRGDTGAAVRVLRRAAAEAGTDRGAVLNNLAVLLAERGRLAEAETIAERAAALPGPHRAAARDTLDDIRRRGSRPE